MNIYSIFWRVLSVVNRYVFPSYINRDLIQLKWYDKALIGWCYFVTKKVLDANSWVDYSYLNRENKIQKPNQNDSVFLCTERELNPHAHKSTAPSRLRVYQFHHQCKICSKIKNPFRKRVLVTWLGLEPRTLSLKGRCSTNWATRSSAKSGANIKALFHFAIAKTQ